MVISAAPRRNRVVTYAEYVVECVWPGVSFAAVDVLDRRARVVARRERRRGSPVHYLGSILLPADEVVLFQFLAGSAAVVVETSAAVGLPFQRVVPAMRTPMEVTP
jgi:hypothetical protein